MSNVDAHFVDVNREKLLNHPKSCSEQRLGQGPAHTCPTPESGLCASDGNGAIALGTSQLWGVDGGVERRRNEALTHLLNHGL